MRKYLFPLLALALGAAGFLVRRWQLADAFEEGSGLLTPGHPATFWLVGLAALTAAVGLACGASCRNCRTVERPPDAGPVWARALLTLPGAGYLAAGALLAASQFPLEFSSGERLLAAYLPALLGLALLAGGVCMLLGLRRPAREQKEGRTGRSAVAAMLPGVACCLLLVYYYHENANNPVVMGYLWMELAMVAGMLAWYGYAKMELGPRDGVRPGWYSVWCIAFQLTALAGENSLPCVLVLLANTAWFTVRYGQLLAEMEGQDAK